MLGRDTKWRQGDLLADEEAYAMGLVEAINSNRYIVVISHDCDLPSEAEPFVEVIVGRLVQAPDPMLVNARNIRRLHLRFESESSGDMYIELRHIDRKLVSKTAFANLVEMTRNFLLPADEKRALKQWLAARYGRPAFPNAFEIRLRKVIGRKSVESRIAKILQPEKSHLVALLFDLGAVKTSELEDGEPYWLSISVVYDATEGGPAARVSAEKVAVELRALFDQAYGAADTASEIALDTCQAVADTSVTLADLRKVDQWRLEYMSLGEGSDGDFLSAGATPV